MRFLDESSQVISAENGQFSSQEAGNATIIQIESQERESFNIERSSIKGRLFQNDQSGFYHWLLDVQQMAEGTSRGYVSTINIIEKYAKEHNMPEAKLYLAPFDEIERINTALLHDQEFLRYNAVQHSRFRTALSRYLEFCQALLEGKSAEVERKLETDEKRIYQEQIGVLSTRGDELYKRLYAMSQVYRDPQGLTVEQIQRIVGGIGSKDSIIGTLEHVDWAVLVAPDTYSFNKDAVPYVKVCLDDFNQEEYIKVLMARYQSGMQLDSIDFDNFRDTYKDYFDEEILCDDKELEARLRLCGLYYNGRLFPIDGVIPPDIKNKLFAYIEANFNRGKKVIYYKAIYSDMAEDFAYCFSLADDLMLKAFIAYTAPEGKYYFYDDYMATEEGVKVDHSEEITEFLLSAGKPMTYDEIYQGLSHISKKIIHDEIRANKAYVMDAKGRYFHIGIFEIGKDEKETIKNVISSEISENGYALWNNVYSRITEEMPIFIENNLYLSSLGIRNAVAIHLKDNYSFDGAIISPKGKSLNMADIYRLYAQTRRKFTETELYDLSKELETGIYYNAVSAVSIRVSRELFIPKEEFHADVREVDRAIGTYLVKDYIPIREIDSFLIFPNVGYEWNKFLLESYLLAYSQQFMLLNNGLSLNNVAGVVVRRNGPIRDFNEACAVALADSGIELKNDTAINYLAEINFVSRRSYRDLDSAIQKAIRIRNRR